ncbi:MAG: type II toxin-antitoxin system Phd/YefM family antitoxin [Myxococcaceae bacterium]
MARAPQIIPVSDLRKDAASVLAKLARSREPVFITQRGRATAALVSMAEYRQASKERELLRMLAQGEKEIAANTGHDIDEVLREADELLETI